LSWVQKQAKRKKSLSFPKDSLADDSKAIKTMLPGNPLSSKNGEKLPSSKYAIKTTRCPSLLPHQRTSSPTNPWNQK
jgi:hypothetical protein